MCSEQLECFPSSSSTMYFGSWNPNFSQIWLILDKIICSKNHNLWLFVQETPNAIRLNESEFSIYFRKVVKKCLLKTINLLMRKKGCWTYFYMVEWCLIYHYKLGLGWISSVTAVDSPGAKSKLKPCKIITY